MNHATRIVCPVCKAAGKKVELFTVRSLVRADWIAGLGGDDYLFCANPDCDVVYYSEGQNLIRKHQLKTRVGLKEKEAPRPVCYCFGHTVEDIHAEIRETGKSTVGREITDKIEASLCHCEDANPEGRCCLGNVAAAVIEALRAYDATKEKQAVVIAAAQDCCQGQS